MNPSSRNAALVPQWKRCDCDRTYHDECPKHGVYGQGLGPSGKLPDPDAAPGRDSAVNPEVVLKMARDLAKDTLALADYAPAEWDGGDPGYLFGGMCGLAEDILAAIPEGGLRV